MVFLWPPNKEFFDTIAPPNPPPYVFATFFPCSLPIPRFPCHVSIVMALQCFCLPNADAGQFFPFLSTPYPHHPLFHFSGTQSGSVELFFLSPSRPILANQPQGVTLFWKPFMNAGDLIPSFHQTNGRHPDCQGRDAPFVTTFLVFYSFEFTFLEAKNI